MEIAVRGGDSAIKIGELSIGNIGIGNHVDEFFCAIFIDFRKPGAQLIGGHLRFIDPITSVLVKLDNNGSVKNGAMVVGNCPNL